MSDFVLSARQRQCLALVRKGLTSLQIAAELGLSRRTVDQYISASCQRFGVRTRTQAVLEAVLRGEI